jgi:hypothetical protein
MSNTEMNMGNLKFGKDTETGDYICHLFVDGEFISELGRLHGMMLSTPAHYKQWMNTMSEWYMATVQKQVLDPAGVPEEDRTLRMEHTDLREKTN